MSALRTCSDCLAPRVGRKKRCSPCERAHHLERQRRYRAANPDIRRAQARRNSAARYARDPEAVKARVRAWTAANRERANALWREANRRRDAVERGCDAERIEYAVVVERDAGMCWLCGHRVDARLRWPDPFSGSIDHIVPISRQGPHTYANVQLAHLRCNISKGAS